MIRRIILRPEAQADIHGIWDYTVGQWDMDRADSYIGDIRAVLRLLAAHPLIGADCGHLSPGLRKFNSGSHSVFYLHDANLIDVVRILHQRMDMTDRL